VIPLLHAGHIWAL